DRRALPRHPAEWGRGPGRGAAREVLLRLSPPDPALPAVRHHGALGGSRRPDRVLVPPLPERAQPARELDPREPGRALGAGGSRPRSRGLRGRPLPARGLAFLETEGDDLPAMILRPTL